jgi:hypothetical protein
MPHITTHVIDGLVGTGDFPPDDCEKLEEIKARTGHNRCSFGDAWTVAGIVFKRLRSDNHD